MEVLHNAIDQIRIKYTNGTDEINGPGNIFINEMANGEIEIRFDQFYLRKIIMVTDHSDSSGMRILISKPIGIDFK